MFHLKLMCLSVVNIWQYDDMFYEKMVLKAKN
jgi:hypothetical protein